MKKNYRIKIRSETLFKTETIMSIVDLGNNYKHKADYINHTVVCRQMFI